MSDTPRPLSESSRPFEFYLIDLSPVTSPEEDALDPYLVQIYGDPRSEKNEPFPGYNTISGK